MAKQYFRKVEIVGSTPTSGLELKKPRRGNLMVKQVPEEHQKAVRFCPAAFNLRVQHSGSASGCQSEYEGSIPFTRSTIKMFLEIFSKITRKKIIIKKFETQKPGLYFYLIFPIAISFLLTFGISRLINHFYPNLFLTIGEVHIHHFAYGFLVLAISGYLALLFDEPKTKYLISLLHGFGLGLALDEFGMWLRLRDDEPIRWGYDGLLIFLGVILLIISAKPGLKMLKILWPFKKAKT